MTLIFVVGEMDKNLIHKHMITYTRDCSKNNELCHFLLDT